MVYSKASVVNKLVTNVMFFQYKQMPGALCQMDAFFLRGFRMPMNNWQYRTTEKGLELIRIIKNV